MSKKLRSTLSLVGLLLLIVVISGVYVFVFQRSKLNEKENKLEELKANDYNTEQLALQYKDLLKRSSEGPYTAELIARYCNHLLLTLPVCSLSRSAYCVEKQRHKLR